MKFSSFSSPHFASTRRVLRLAAFLGAATLPATFLLPGCGGGGGGNGPSTALAAGGQVNLGNSQLGNLGLGVLSNDTVYGNFDIINNAPTPAPGVTPTATPTATLFPVGRYGVSGNRRGNRLTLAGTIPDNGLISIDATLTQGTTAGSFTVKIKGQSFTGPLVTATPTPTATRTATATPTATATTAATAVVVAIP